MRRCTRMSSSAVSLWRIRTTRISTAVREQSSTTMPTGASIASVWIPKRVRRTTFISSSHVISVCRKKQLPKPRRVGLRTIPTVSTCRIWCHTGACSLTSTFLSARAMWPRSRRHRRWRRALHRLCEPGTKKNLGAGKRRKRKRPGRKRIASVALSSGRRSKRNGRSERRVLSVKKPGTQRLSRSSERGKRLVKGSRCIIPATTTVTTTNTKVMKIAISSMTTQQKLSAGLV
mmetsp:Transcript_16217/g.35255  ORF Transcript_16217/g.35255 Transcript_16217/m.35255 type:complete len:232 (+) Transcript_16217:82-777(+)